MGGARSDEGPELTGRDERGMEVFGNRAIRVGDAGTGGEGPLPAAEGPVVELYGGPLDGFYVKPLRQPTEDLEQLVIVDANGSPSDELYLARPLDEKWYGVHASLLQAVIRSDEVHVKEPDPLELRMRLQEVFGPNAKFAIDICEPGQHRWTDWVQTPRGNKTRTCVICKTSQGTYV